MSRPLKGLVEKLFEFEGYSEIAFWARGHLDKREFRHEVDFEFDHCFPLERVLHAFARNVPVGRDRPGEMVVWLDVEPRRGAYPITFIDLMI